MISWDVADNTVSVFIFILIAIVSFCVIYLLIAAPQLGKIDVYSNLMGLLYKKLPIWIISNL